MTAATARQLNASRKKLTTGKKVLIAIGIGLLLIVAIALFTRWYFFRPVQPTQLSQAESQVLDQKLENLGITSFKYSGNANDQVDADEGNIDNKVEPIPYREKNALRNIQLSEREINGIIARDPQLSRRMVIDLAPDLASTQVVLDIPDGFPLFSGQSIRIHAGLELRIENSRPMVKLRGVSLMGVPIPNAWLGGLKNVDLVQHYGDTGFWHTFAAGVESIEVLDGALHIQLKP